MCEDGKKCSADTDLDFLKARAFMAAHKREFDLAFEHSLKTNKRIAGIRQAAAEKSMERVNGTIDKLVREFYDAGIISVLAVQSANERVGSTIEAMLDTLPPNLRNMLGEILGKATKTDDLPEGTKRAAGVTGMDDPDEIDAFVDGIPADHIIEEIHVHNAHSGKTVKVDGKGSREALKAALKAAMAE